jgi:hypothetical protein
VRSKALLIACLATGACSELATPPERPHEAVSVEPLGDLSAAPSVLRLRVKGAGGRAALADYGLFSGHLSSYYLHRLRAREVPDTLAARGVAVVTWDEGGDVVIAPTQALPSGVFSLTTPELGLVAEVTVAADLVPWLERRWPPRGMAEGTGLAIFCGEGVLAAGVGQVTLAPSGTTADVRLGVDESGSFGDTCLEVVPRPGAAVGSLSLPPLLVGGVALEPLPLVTSTLPAAAFDCGEGELALGPACANVDDDRLVLRAAGAPSFWAFGLPSAALALVDAGRSFVLKGLDPAGVTRVRATALDVMGGTELVDVDVTTREPHAHVVINEVLSNPVGPETSGEWVELGNDGAAAVDLAGFVLRDAGGALTLPAAPLAPAELVLLVNESFEPDAALDVLPRARTRVVRLPTLGTSGLANGGEPLRLSDANGRLSSSFPSLPARAAGVSLARRTLQAPDADATAFGPHAAPGASPGGPNVLADP